ncbi:hypothetical protein EV175_005588, partial [Coemansia sp. RSA 1933]
MSAVKDGGGSGSISYDRPGSPIEDLDFDSTGSLTSLESLLSDDSDSSTNAEDPSDNTQTPTLPLLPETEPPAVKAKEAVCSRKRPNQGLVPPDTPTEEGIITTGAFLTRATLRKLGVVSNPPDPDTISTGITVGDRVKVLDLDKIWYTAIVLAISSGKVLVHYPFWDHSYNEWVGIDSRRLLYRGKQGFGTDDSTQAVRMLQNWGDHIGDVDIDSFDLQAAIDIALNTRQSTVGEDVANKTGSPVFESSDADTTAPETSNQVLNLQRGRPKGSRNRRRAGHIKRRTRRPPQTPDKSVDSSNNSVKALVATTATDATAAEPDEAEEVVVVAPQVPKDMRISEIRVLSSMHNPYAKRPRLHVVSESESDCNDQNDSTIAAEATSDLLHSEMHERTGEATEEGGEQSRGNAIWDLTRGPYVTTGAFFTRRTVKCLTHSESMGGIMTEHHGYYPGQLVDVLNANRTWYTGRVLSYANKKFLINFNGWPHSHNEWIPAGSKRMRAVTRTRNVSGSQSAETEEDARRICAVLVNEYNAYVDGLERKKAEKERLKRERKQQFRKTPVHQQPRLASSAMTISPVTKPSEDTSMELDAEDSDDADGSVEPISVDHGYNMVPQLLRVKDYTRIYRKGMDVAARDRNKLWWRARITDIKSFRLRIHYIGFRSAWDEWVEMNTQRIMFPSVPQQNDEDIIPDSEAAKIAHNTPAGIAGEAERDDGIADKQMVVVQESKPVKRLGRPPGPEAKSAPLSLRLALKACMSDQINHEQCHPEDVGMFHLPKEHMSTKDYSIFLKVGDKVRIRDRDKQWQDCTIIDYKHGNIRVCYAGLSDEYNQWIPVNSDRIRVLRNTVQSDGRLEKMEKESRIALRRKREKARAERRKRKQASMASLVHLAESLEYIVDRADLLNSQGSSR